MSNILRNRKGQGTAEYAILIALVVAGAMAMQTYVKRSLSAGVKYAVDKVTVKSDKTPGTTQYEPYYMVQSYETTSKTYADSEETKDGGEVVRTYGVGGSKKSERTGFQQTKAPEKTN